MSATRKYDYINANLSNHELSEKELSLGKFHGANLKNASLVKAAMIRATFSNETILEGADVDGLLVLLAKCKNEDITREWLHKKGAKNAYRAITCVDTLKEMLSKGHIELDTAKKYRDKILSCLWSMVGSTPRLVNNNFLRRTKNPEADVLAEANEVLNNFIQMRFAFRHRL